MSYTPLISKILLSFIISSTVLYRYGNWFRHRISVTLTVLLAWFCSFLIIFALPLDIISVCYPNQFSSRFLTVYNVSDCVQTTKPNWKLLGECNQLQFNFYSYWTMGKPSWKGFYKFMEDCLLEHSVFNMVKLIQRGV